MNPITSLIQKLRAYASSVQQSAMTSSTPGPSDRYHRSRRYLPTDTAMGSRADDTKDGADSLSCASVQFGVYEVAPLGPNANTATVMARDGTATLRCPLRRQDLCDDTRQLGGDRPRLGHRRVAGFDENDSLGGRK